MKTTKTDLAAAQTARIAASLAHADAYAAALAHPTEANMARAAETLAARDSARAAEAVVKADAFLAALAA